MALERRLVHLYRCTYLPRLTKFLDVASAPNFKQVVDKRVFSSA